MNDVHFSIGVPKFITEVIDRTRSLVISYGRLDAKESPVIEICFQGRVLHSINRLKLKSTKDIDFVALGKKIDEQIADQSRSTGYRHEKLTAKAKSQLINSLMRSVLLRYFGLLKKQTPTDLVVTSMVNQIWNPKEYEFEESPVYGKPITADISVKHGWRGYTPPEQRKRRSSDPIERTEAEVLEKIQHELDFWLFGPVVESR